MKKMAIFRLDFQLNYDYTITMNAKNDEFQPEINVFGELQKLTEQLQEQITAACRRGENSKIFTLAERLRRTDSLMQNYEIIRQETKELARPKDTGSQANHAHLPLTVLSHNGSYSQKETRKERGQRLRTAWIANFGNTLKHLRRTLYHNSKGEVVGVACATEKMGADGPKGRWWLGLPNGQFQSAVLLCEKSDGRVHGVCLPRSFVEAHRSRFSKSEGGQEQFNVFKDGIKWYLQVPTAGTVEVTMYVDNPTTVL